MKDEGIVKRYLAEKGYGFITPRFGGKDVFFHVSDISDVQKPKELDWVSYTTETTEKGLVAREISYLRDSSGNICNDSRETNLRTTIEIHSSRSSPRIDDRPICSSCGRKMTPRVKFVNGEPKYNFCPYCLSKHEQIGCVTVLAAMAVSLLTLASLMA